MTERFSTSHFLLHNFRRFWVMSVPSLFFTSVNILKNIVQPFAPF